MSFATALAEDQRLIMLRALSEAAGSQLNETILKFAAWQFGHKIPRDVVRSHISWLAEQGLVRLEKINTGADEFWVAHLKNDGEEVAQGRPWPGVGRRLD